MMQRLHVARLVSVWLRLLLVTLSLHLGAMAVGAFVMDDPCAEEETECCSDCPLERSGEECPSDCPNCHCHHGGAAIALPEVKSEDVTLPAREENVDKGPPPEATTPRQPFLASVFRPPRMRSFPT